MKYLYFIIALLFLKQTYANSVSCEFEEVYKDGSIQTGHMLFSEGLLRYQYNDKQLFTIIYNKNYYVIRNDENTIVNKLKNDAILNELRFIIADYPKIKNTYIKDDLKITIQNSQLIEFIKRISINSQKVNLSIYFINCTFEDISKGFFQPFSLKEIRK